jgi:hypothetical protein
MSGVNLALFSYFVAFEIKPLHVILIPSLFILILEGFDANLAPLRDSSLCTAVFCLYVFTISMPSVMTGTTIIKIAARNAHTCVSVI